MHSGKWLYYIWIILEFLLFGSSPFQSENAYSALEVIFCLYYWCSLSIISTLDKLLNLIHILHILYLFLLLYCAHLLAMSIGLIQPDFTLCISTVKFKFWLWFICSSVPRFALWIFIPKLRYSTNSARNFFTLANGEFSSTVLMSPEYAVFYSRNCPLDKNRPWNCHSAVCIW